MKHIIVARTDKIGDLVLSIPSFFMLRKIYPKAKITVLVRSYNYEIVKNIPYINEVIQIDQFEHNVLKSLLKSYHADAFVALYNDKQVASLARGSGARIRVGPLSKVLSYFSYNQGVRQKRSHSLKNEAHYNLDLIRQLNPQRFDDCFEMNHQIYYLLEHKIAAEHFLTTHNIHSPTLLINPFVGGSAKTITDQQYQVLISRLLEENPQLNIVIAAHVTDAQRAEKLLLPFMGRPVFLFINQGDLLNLVALIDQMNIYLGGSTGPTHIAGSLNKKVVAIYPNKKTQHPTRWGVLGTDHVTYIIPDSHHDNEDYSIEFFQHYDRTTEDEIIDAVRRYLD